MTLRTMLALILIVGLNTAGCAVCKSTDSPEVCRTKERNHSQPRIDLAAALFRGLTG